tara:strand:- start:87 stop:269 length:183 start_codon:yes stop_codon:yes gene_type:complete
MRQTHHNEVLEMQARQTEYTAKLQAHLAPKVASGEMEGAVAQGHRDELLLALQAEHLMRT